MGDSYNGERRWMRAVRGLDDLVTINLNILRRCLRLNAASIMTALSGYRVYRGERVSQTWRIFDTHSVDIV